MVDIAAKERASKMREFGEGVAESWFDLVPGYVLLNLIEGGVAVTCSYPSI